MREQLVMPRTSKILDPEVVDRIINAVRTGCSYRAAASAGPISESTFHSWMRQAEFDEAGGRESEYREFSARVDEANASAERMITQAWFAHCRTDWRSCRDFLARRHPTRWGPTTTVDVNSTHGYLSNDEVLGGLADQMERWLQTHDADVAPVESLGED